MAHWSTRGGAAAKAFANEESQKEAQREQSNKMWRFYLKEGQEARITFIDGNLDETGALDAFSFPQHQVFANGRWNNFFVCTKHEGYCPLCESGDVPARVAVLTVIDHRETKSKDGTKTYRDQKRLFVMKHDTYQILQNMAKKRGGLAGITVDVMRTGDRSPNVGNHFDFIEKNPVEKLRQAFTKKVKKEDGSEVLVTDFTPANYEEEIVYHSPSELEAMGFGSAPASPMGMQSQQSSVADTDYSDNL